MASSNKQSKKPVTPKKPAPEASKAAANLARDSSNKQVQSKAGKILRTYRDK